MNTHKAPSWMRHVLAAAATYNIAWGAAVVLFPVELFRLTGLKPPEYPEIVQCLGMVIGVYGIAYAIASTNPIRHWPIVVTGLTGKVFGPLGFAYAATRGRLPWRAGWTILTNDLIWWIPFGLILSAAYSSYLCHRRGSCPEVLKFALRTRTTHGCTLDHMSYKAPILLVFLRQLGCTFCREALADLAAQRRSIEATGTEIVLVHMSDERAAEKCFRQYGVSDLAQIRDPEQNLYRAFGLRRGSLGELFGPRVMLRGLGLLPRHGIGPMTGDGFQMPGVFLICHGEVIRSFRHQSVADRPAYAEFAAAGGPLELGMQA